MASRHVRWVLANRLKYPDPLDREIMIAIATHIGYDDQPARVSIATIAEYAGCHFNTADKRTKALAEAGALVIDKAGRFLTYTLPQSADGETATGDEPPPGTDAARPIDGLDELREELRELRTIVTSLSHDVHTIVTSLSHDVHMTSTPAQGSNVNKEGKKGRREEEKKRRREEEREFDTPANGSGNLLLARYAPAPETPEERALLAHPATLLWVKVTKRWPGYSRLSGIVERLGDDPDEEALARAWEAWDLSGHNPDNVLGIIDWYSEMHADPEWEPGQRYRQSPRASHAGRDSRNGSGPYSDQIPEEYRDLIRR